MYKLLLNIFVCNFLICSVIFAEVSRKIKDQAKILYSEEAKNNFDSKITEIKSRKVSSKLETFCKPYQLFLVGVFVPKEKRTSMTPDVIYYKMASAADAISINNSKKIAAFLSKLKKPIYNEEDVLERVSVFAELLDAEITTNMPARKSIIKKYMDQKPENWELIISGTESGWKIHVTLMIDMAIEYCIRYELEFTKDGNMSVLKEKDIYSYSLYE